MRSRDSRSFAASLYDRVTWVLVTLVLTIVLAALIIAFALIVTSINDMVQASLNYYRVVDVDEQACRDFGKMIGSTVEWRDETFMGFGPEDSYGCYLIKEKE